MTLGEPLRRMLGERAGVREFEVVLTAAEAAEGLPLEQVASRAGVSLGGSEGSPLIVVNGRVVPPEYVGRVRVQDGDRVDFEVMLSGG